MNTEEAITQLRGQIYDLEKKVESEVRKVGSTLLTADLSSYRDAPRMTAEIFTPEWDKQREAQDQYIEAVRKGDIPKSVEITMTPIGSISKSIPLTEELTDAIEAFEDYVEVEYAYKLQNLQRKLSALQQMRKAERQLDRA